MRVSIALSGGAVHGAFEVGALKHILERGHEIVHISGTSIGAINGAATAQGDFEALEKKWLETKDASPFFKHWLPFSYLQGVFLGSLYNSTPLKRTIAEIIDPEKLVRSETLFTSCSVNLNRDEKFYLDSIPKNKDLIRDFIYASAAFPFAFQPHSFNGDYFWDGGLKEPIPVKTLVDRTWGAREPEKYLVILATPLIQQPRKSLKKSLLPLGLAAVDTMFSEIFSGDVEKGMKFWNSEKFEIIAPEFPYFKSSFDFDPDRIRTAIRAGYEAAKLVC